ncbi:porin [Stutzerimonas chloritidismutans]
MIKHMLAKAISVGVVATVFSATTVAETSVEDLAGRLESMQKEMDELKQQLKNTVSKEEVSEVKQNIAAASEWRQPDTLIHMTGYASAGYTDSESADGSFNVGTFAPIFHFQYRDIAMLESELEFTIGPDGETDVALEYLTVDWFLNDYMVLVGGKFISPVGQFRQNLHPAWINKLPSAPPGFDMDGAAPVSDVGFQLRGGFPIGSVRTNYAIFASNGPELMAEVEDGEFGLDGVEAEGFGSDRDGEKTYGGRFGVIPFAGLEIGVSAATGKATVTSIEDGDSSLLSGEGARDYDVVDADFNWQINAFNLRGEYVKTEVGADNGSGAAASEGAVWKTWYTQGSYRLSQSKWELVARYTDFDSPHDSKDQQQWALGANYLVTNNFIGKFAYEFNDGATGSVADEDRLMFQLAYGF